MINEENKLINSDFLNGLNIADAKDNIIRRLEQDNKGQKKNKFID